MIQGTQVISKDEDHYFTETPIELATVLSKVLAEALISSSSIDENKDQLPPELYRLISHGSRKSDPDVEQDIYRKYLVKARKMIEEKYLNLIEENKKLSSQIDKLQKTASQEDAGRGDLKSRLRNLSKASGSQDTGPSNPAAQGDGHAGLDHAEDQRRGNSANIEEIDKGVKKNPSMNQLIDGKRASALGPRLHSASRRSAGMQRQTLSVSRAASQPE